MNRSLRRAIILTPLGILLAGGKVPAAVWYVPADAPTIQAGIDSATPGDTVLVACGTYGEHDIVMKSGVVLRSEIGDPSCVTIDAQGQGRVAYGHRLESGTALVGLTLTGGVAMGDEGITGSGGGVFCSTSVLTVVRCRFEGNEAWGGGGFLGAGSSPEFDECTFTGNNGHGWGGGAYFRSRSYPVFRDCEFSDNSASRGGALTCDKSRATLEGSRLASNWGYYGGAVYCQLGGAASLEECEIVGNSAGEGGGGYWGERSGLLKMTRCLLADNSAQSGGGICQIDLPPPDLADCIISGNTAWAEGSGGGVFCGQSLGRFRNCLFVGNRAGTGGGLASYGGLSPTITGCTFYGNGAQTGGAIACGSSSSPLLVSTILAFGVEGGAVGCWDASGRPVLGCCDVFGNEGGDWNGCIADQAALRGNFSADPLFCGAPDGDFTLAATSPCLPGHHPAGYDCGLIGDFGSGCSGPTPVEHTSWGGIKKMFR